MYKLAGQEPLKIRDKEANYEEIDQKFGWDFDKEAKVWLGLRMLGKKNEADKFILQYARERKM